MNTQIVIDVVSIIMRAVIVIAVLYVIPFIKEKIHGTKYEKFLDYVAEIVQAMDQVFTKEECAEKKEKALKLAKEYLAGTSLKITDEQVDTLIESAVQTLRIVQKEAE